MKPIHFLIAGVAALASAACNAEQQPQGSAGAGAATGPVAKVERPASGDWTEAVVATNEGGFVMGNPDASVKLVEFGSMTCSACAAFDQTALPQLLDKHVKTGKVSFEFRNFVRDPYDITAALIARCNGAKTFFPLTRAMFEDQAEWTGKLQQVPPEQMQGLQSMPPEQQFTAVAKWAGLQQFAAMRGVPAAKSSQCLADQNEINRLVQMNSDATSQYDVAGTPTFLINGEAIKEPGWQGLEPAIQQALGEGG
ncbi:MAG: DsbA family protein [Pseudomonadota bacterium]|nr:thioredoxin domain-containing protein [Sphingomonas sp.]MDQ3478087.1 DsbA family protein [Pseudomonadota bacterium]